MPLTPKEAHRMILSLRGNDENERKIALDSIPAISEVLGLARTADELVPYLLESASFSEMQWITAIAKISQIPFSGATVKQISKVLTRIAAACDMESRAIRSTCVDSITSIITALQDSKKQTTAIKSVLYFMTEQNTPALSASAVVIFSRLVGLVEASLKARLFDTFVGFENSPVVMVRHGLATAAAGLVKYLKGAHEGKIRGTMIKFASDPSYSVACEVPKFLAAYLKANGKVEHALEIGKKLMENSHWRVRCEYIRSLEDIYSGQDVGFDLICPLLIEAVNDEEDEVKTAAAEELPYLAKLKGIERGDVANLMSDLFESTCPHVRTSAVRSLPLFINHLTSDFVATSLLQMTKDQSQEVKITAIEALKSKEIPTKTKIDCITEAAKSPQWREKDSLAVLLPLIYRPEESSQFITVVIKLLFDDARDVRRRMLAQLKYMVDGPQDNMADDLLNAFKVNIESDDYQIRQTCIEAVVEANLHLTPIGKEVLSKAAQDPVANVRLVAAEHIPRIPEFANLLNALKKDDDEDVAEAAQ